MRRIRPSHSSTVRTWAGKQMFANSRKAMLTMALTARPKKKLRSLLKSTISLKPTSMKAEKASSLERKEDKLFLKHSPMSISGMPTSAQLMKFQTACFQTNLTLETLMDSISLTHLETKELVAPAILCHLHKS